MYKSLFRFIALTFLGLNVCLASDGDRILQPDKTTGRKVPVAANKAIIRFRQGLSQIDYNKFFNKHKISIDNPILEKSQSIIFSKNKNSNEMLTVDKVNRILKAEEPLLRTFIITYTENIIPEIFCKKLLKNNDFIEIAEPLALDETLAYMPNDPKVAEQGLLATCKIFDAWDIWKGDTSIVIGISDGGIYQEHEDLINNIAPNWNEIPNDNIDHDNNGYIDDFIGCNLAYKDDGTLPGVTYHTSDHGTGVASIAAASTDNNKGIAGVGFKCRFFPIKTAKLSSDKISYGYQSIVYAALRGFKILNCSWGSAKQFSQIDQSIIDYAVSRDVAIVAAAGNENGDIIPVYPAAYKGVLSVGNVDVNDEMAGSSSLGANLDIMAPGEGSYVATNTQGVYMIEGQGGTSFASPVVAGILGLVRSKYPGLTALEAIAFTRMAVDDIRSKNPFNAGILPGRINALKAVTTDPMSIPGISYLSHKFLINGEETDRIYSGQTADLKINCTNLLGNGSNLRFVLSAGYDFQNTINIIDSVVVVGNVPRNSSFWLDKFTFSCNNDFNGTIILRIDIYDDNGYRDFFMIPFIPASEVTNFGNNVVQFSVGDRGQIGFAGSGSDIQGIGVKYKNLGNMIYNAGLMLTAENSGNKYISSSLFGSYPNYNDFIAVKSFVPPVKNRGILNDEGNFINKLNAEVEQVYNVPPDNINIISVDVTIKNNSALTYNSMSAGYFFDWDIIPVSDSNLVGLLPEAIPESFKAVAAAAEFASYYWQDKSIFCGCASFSNNDTNRAQATGMNYSTVEDFNLTEQFAALNSDKNIQYPDCDDINMVVGMKFPGPIAPNESRSFKFFFGCADNKNALAESIKNSMLGLSIEKPDISTDLRINIFPVPADDNLNISLINVSDNVIVEFCDILGRSVLDRNVLEHPSNEYNIAKNISSLHTGVYFVKVLSGGNFYIYPFITN